ATRVALRLLAVDVPVGGAEELVALQLAGALDVALNSRDLPAASEVDGDALTLWRKLALELDATGLLRHPLTVRRREDLCVLAGLWVDGDAAGECRARRHESSQEATGDGQPRERPDKLREHVCCLPATLLRGRPAPAAFLTTKGVGRESGRSPGSKDGARAGGLSPREGRALQDRRTLATDPEAKAVVQGTLLLSAGASAVVRARTGALRTAGTGGNADQH